MNTNGHEWNGKSQIVLALLALMATALTACSTGTGAEGFYKGPAEFTIRPDETAKESPIGNFGPTGLEIVLVQPAWTIKVTGVQKGSPAEGKFEKDQLIVSINGSRLADIDPRIQLGNYIADAEATDGVLKCMVKATPGAEPKEVVLTIPALGPFSKTWPLDCRKTEKIIRANADYIAGLVKTSKDGLTGHNLYNGLAILTLLSTGEEKDLNVVRGIYKQRMSGFRGTVGAHNWHNGYQGIAACEYYLRTGDKSVIPLINAICESSRKYQYYGGWNHWSTAANVQYVAGGLLNAAGAQVATTLLLAKQCGAKVNQRTMRRATTFFYRFAGHGSTPYGDHRPEGGYTSANGKSSMLAIIMGAAARADTGGENYALARDKMALTALYSYPHMLRGHTGGGLGELWRGIAASHMIEKKPVLYRNMMDVRKWFYDLSRRHDGSFGICGGARYDKLSYGLGMCLSLTAPRRTLQITGAPRSKFAKSFTLPAQPWGRKADLAVLSIEGGSKYGERTDLPHIEMAKIAEAGEDELERYAYHPEIVYREFAADTMRQKGYFRLVEKLLESDDSRARRAGCMALNRFQPWQVTRSKGWISLQSIDPKDFTPKMFASLLKIIKNPDESIWGVDGALMAMAVARPELVKANMDVIFPWLEHQEWWLHESASMALSPVLEDPEGLKLVLGRMVHMLGKDIHLKGRGYVEWMLSRTAAKVSPEMRKQISDALVQVYRASPSTPSVPGEIDRSAIGYMLLKGTATQIITINPKAALEVARLTVLRKSDLTPRNATGLNAHLDLLLGAAGKLSESERRKLGAILTEHYRPIIVEQNREHLEKELQGHWRYGIAAMNKLIKIDTLAGLPGGWKLLGQSAKGEQQWQYHSFEPKEKLDKSDYNRYRDVTLPADQEGWFTPEFDPAKHGWKEGKAVIGDTAPEGYRRPAEWMRERDSMGEVLLMRKSFEMEDFDYAKLRLIAFSRQGYRIYLNGNLVFENKGRSKTWAPRVTYFDEKMTKHLNKGTNVLAATSFMQYFRGKEGNIEVYMEGLRKYPKFD